MNQNYSNVLAAMERYVEVVGRLSIAIQSGQEALVRMDLSAFEQLTIEQERLCAELKAMQLSAELNFDSRDKQCDSNLDAGEHAEFCRQRAALGQRCLAIQERVRYLNRVSRFFLNRAKQSLEVLLRLATPAEVTYSPPSLGLARRSASEG
jgi:hypothetical protein